MIRPYDARDSDRVLEIFLEASIAGQSFLDEEFWHRQVPVVRDGLMAISTTWVVEDQGKVVAFIALLGNTIGGLFTDPGRQGRGHGSALISHVASLYEPLFVEVFGANARAVGFYSKRGFIHHARRINRESGLPELILRLDPARHRESGD
jgi:GNAT superfamily N-acetyltransferase